MSTTEMMDLERLEIIRMLFAVDSSEVLDSVKSTISRYLSASVPMAAEPVTPPCQFTVEELKSILRRAQTDQEGMPHEEFFAELEKEEKYL